LSEYTYIPKSIKRVKEESKYGISVKFVFLSIFMGFLSLVLVYKSISSTLRFYTTLIFLILIWSFIIVYFRTLKLWNRSTTILRYIISYIKDECIIRKFKDDESKLLDIVWIKKFHNEGIIEFFGNRYGLLLKSDPDRISDDDLDAHIVKIKHLIDSIDIGKLISFYVSSTSILSYKPLETAIVQSINEKGKSNQEKEHLYGLYDEINQDKTPIISWKFYILVDLGEHKSIDQAIISKQHYFPGIEQRLIQTDMHVVSVYDKYELMKIFHECITQESHGHS
jgi:hypothetical protein